jgi:hypothetical protein
LGQAYSSLLEIVKGGARCKWKPEDKELKATEKFNWDWSVIKMAGDLHAVTPVLFPV